MAAARPLWLLNKALGLLPYWLPAAAPTRAAGRFQLRATPLDRAYSGLALLAHAALGAGCLWGVATADLPPRERCLLAAKFAASVATVTVAILSDLFYNRPRCETLLTTLGQIDKSIERYVDTFPDRSYRRMRLWATSAVSFFLTVFVPLFVYCLWTDRDERERLRTLCGHIHVFLMVACFMRFTCIVSVIATHLSQLRKCLALSVCTRKHPSNFIIFAPDSAKQLPLPQGYTPLAEKSCNVHSTKRRVTWKGKCKLAKIGEKLMDRYKGKASASRWAVPSEGQRVPSCAGIADLRAAYRRLCDVSSDLTACHEPTLACGLSLLLMTLILCSYMLHTASSGTMLVRYVLIQALNVTALFLFVLPAREAHLQVEGICYEVWRLLESPCCPPARRQLLELSQLLSARSPRVAFCVYGAFTLDTSLLVGVASTLTTYLVLVFTLNV